MKALIIYDDIACAANTTAILRRVGHDANVAIEWEIRPWRLQMLKSPPTAKQALGDATDAHLIVFAVRSTPKFPVWTMDWLERWAGVRCTPDAALAIIGDGPRKTAAAQASEELSQFARRHGLSFISADRRGTGEHSPFSGPPLQRGHPPSIQSNAHFPIPESNESRDINL
jgi:hypothetical protein